MNERSHESREAVAAFDPLHQAPAPKAPPSGGPESYRLAAALAQHAGRSADASRVADTMVSVWQDVEAALSPVLGRRGVAALYERSLFLAAATHPWLAGMHEGVRATIDFAALKTLLTKQTHAEAAAGSGSLLHAFRELLGSLIGPALAERLLRAVWLKLSSGTAAKDIST